MQGRGGSGEGRRAWPDASLIAFRGPERAVVFAVRQAPRPDAREVVARLSRAGLAVEILSGDREEAVAEVARELVDLEALPPG